MKKIRAKMRKLKMTRWNKLTRGEKVAKVVLKLVKYAVIAAIIVLGISVVAAVAIGVFAAFAIASAIAGGFENASNAYRPGDRYVRFWK